MLFRSVQKGDDRPGGYIVTGGHGGVVGTMGKPGPAVITYRPNRHHTFNSAVRLDLVPEVVAGVRLGAAGLPEAVEVRVKDAAGDLLESAIPKVTIFKHARYDEGSTDAAAEIEVMGRLAHDLEHAPLAGFVAEGSVPYAHVGPSRDAAIRLAIFSGLPVVKVSRGNADGYVFARNPMGIAGANLTATKARLLLTALVRDPGHVFWADDLSITDASRFPSLAGISAGGLTDAYLLALARHHGARFATFDRGIWSAGSAEVRQGVVRILPP